MKVVVEIIELRFDLPAKPKPPAEGEPTIDRRCWKHRANTAKVAYHDAKRRADELAEDRARLVAVATKWLDRAEVWAAARKRPALCAKGFSFDCAGGRGHVTRLGDRGCGAEAELAEIKQAVTESSPAKVAELRTFANEQRLRAESAEKKLADWEIRLTESSPAKLAELRRERDLLLKQRDDFAARNVELQKQLTIKKIADSPDNWDG